MKLLNDDEISMTHGGAYGFCDFLSDGTVGFFTAAGAIVGGATTFGFGSAVGGYAGHMLGSWAADIVYNDCQVR